MKMSFLKKKPFLSQVRDPQQGEDLVRECLHLLSLGNGIRARRLVAECLLFQVGEDRVQRHHAISQFLQTFGILLDDRSFGPPSCPEFLNAEPEFAVLQLESADPRLLAADDDPASFDFVVGVVEFSSELEEIVVFTGSLF